MHRLVERAPASVPTPPASRKWFFLDSSTGLPSFKDSSGNVVAMLLSDAELTAIAALVSAANKIPMFSGSGVATLLDFDTDNTLAADSDTRIASQKAIKAFVAAQIAALIGTAPGVLDTLGEISDALADDASFAATMTTALAGKLAIANNLSDLANAGTARTNLNVEDHGFPYVIDGGGAAIQAGEKAGYVRVPFTGHIVGWTLLGDPAHTGSIIIDSWLDTYASFPPTVADTIWGGSKPTLVSADKAEATGLSIAVTKGQLIRHKVDSASTLWEATLNYHLTRS